MFNFIFEDAFIIGLCVLGYTQLVTQGFKISSILYALIAFAIIKAIIAYLKGKSKLDVIKKSKQQDLDEKCKTKTVTKEDILDYFKDSTDYQNIRTNTKEQINGYIITAYGFAISGTLVALFEFITSLFEQPIVFWWQWLMFFLVVFLYCFEIFICFAFYKLRECNEKSDQNNLDDIEHCKTQTVVVLSKVSDEDLTKLTSEFLDGLVYTSDKTYSINKYLQKEAVK